MARSREITSQQLDSLTIRLQAAQPTAQWNSGIVREMVKRGAYSYAEENRRYAKIVARVEKIEAAA